MEIRSAYELRREIEIKFQYGYVIEGVGGEGYLVVSTELWCGPLRPSLDTR